MKPVVPQQKLGSQPVRLAPVGLLHGDLRVLIIDAKRLPSSLQADLTMPVVHTQMRFLSQRLLREIRPDIVVAPLISGSWDILDLAEALEAAGYEGRVVVISPPLPNERLIVDEVLAICPHVKLVLVDASS